MGFKKAWLLSGYRFDKEEKSIAVLPVGSFERHGGHLPLGTDTIEAEYVAEKVAERLDAHLYPPIWYGCSRSLDRFPGTISVDEEGFRAYVEDVLRGLVRNEYKLILIVNGHGGNTNVLKLAAKRVSSETGAVITIVDWWRDVAQEKRRQLFSSPGHAGEDETSAMLHIVPDYVDMDKARDYEAPWFPKLSTYSPRLEELLYPEAVLGKASQASAEKGREWLEAVIDEITSIVKEIYEKLVKHEQHQA